ncbi:MAG: hypothetical protein K6G76_09010 [Lachnospiraceae bacterium]|nr:hypothetical protein [Lachnospiraceae bacterium]
MDFALPALMIALENERKTNEALRNMITSLNDELEISRHTIKELNLQLNASKGLIQEMNVQLNSTKKALAIRESQIESAVLQYNKLMETAIAYRNDALRKRHLIT